jgi:cytochrome c oxidase subunit 3
MEIAERRRREVVPSSVLAMLVFVATEVMFFLGLISAFTISRAGASPGAWSLPSTPLPAASTALNTLALFASGILVFVAYRQMSPFDSPAGAGSRRAGRAGAVSTLLAAWILGALFVGLQGREWWQLLSAGFTLQASRLAAFFYVIVGAHALHAVAALIALAIAWRRLTQGTLSLSFYLGAATFWYFVVGVWPIIYLRVYF